MWRVKPPPGMEPGGGSFHVRLAKRPQTVAYLLAEELRLLERGEVPALRKPAVMQQFGVGTFGPAPRGWIQLVGEDAHRGRDGDPFDIEVPFAEILPIETGAGDSRVRQPGDGDVVEDVVPREALGLSVEDAYDELVAAQVVIEEICREADRRVRNPV